MIVEVVVKKQDCLKGKVIILSKGEGAEKTKDEMCGLAML
jgi:hypothetical protein